MRITDWIHESGGELAMSSDPWTALCPECGIDAVIGSATGYPVNDLVFLKAMNEEWFGETHA
ncbi:hypothetical protein [Sphingomonas faeni]|uniref:hypothetical protein n=1 Tax=Sphingomonas faeni TaxID=185950 RepID=UPI003364C107